MLYRNLLIPDDAGTVAHVGFLGPSGGIFDSAGNVWTQNGTVPQVEGQTVPAGAGPFSDANYYSLNPDPLAFTGDFTICVVLLGQPSGFPIEDGLPAPSGTGYFLETFNNGSLRFAMPAGASANNLDVSAANAKLGAGINVLCAGIAGSVMMVKSNLGPIQTLTIGSRAAGTGPFFLGRGNSAGGSFASSLYELQGSTTTSSDALFTSIQQRVKRILGITAW